MAIKLMQLKRKINIYRRYRYWSSKKCIFIHVPKVAGTSINHALYGRTLGHYTAQEIRSTFPSLFENSFSFSFVRNPWGRLASAYRFAKAGRTETMGIYKPERYQIPEFESFERFVCEWLPRKNINKLDFVFQPQSRFVTNGSGGIIVDFLGKLERLDKDIKHVEKNINRSLAIPELNRTGKVDGDMRSLYVSNEMVDVVSRIYANDIELFNYSFE
ncbi:sulfotransferase family 2 domain-containing protein [Halomonas mongoliensis]|uniref:sulfotransferase family 2 domain-containing protein n=1 Tax=Halomonas mongoliensis TaxID=321265 RepID=UPI00403AC078